MKYLAFAAIVLLFSACGFNETTTNAIDGQDLFFPFNASAFSWKGIEKQNNDVKKRFILLAPKLLENEYARYADTSLGMKTRLEEFNAALHVVDLNGDNKDDLIYVGESGGEPQEIAFIQNTNNGFKVIFKEQQEITRLLFDKKKIKEIYVTDKGCCASNMIFNKIYQVNWDSKAPEFKRTYFSGHDQHTYMPQKYLEASYKIEVLNDNYKMRFKPIIDDTCTTYRGGEPLKGNTIATLNKGTTGRAIASQKDNTGRLWLLVELSSDHTIKSDVFYDDNEKDRSAKLGWISSRYVKRAGY